MISFKKLNDNIFSGKIKFIRYFFILLLNVIISRYSSYELTNRDEYNINYSSIYICLTNFFLKNKFLKKLKTTIVSKFYLNITASFFNYLIDFYKIKPSKYIRFNFKYLWKNILSTSYFWFSSYSSLKYAWLSFRSTRSNYFGTFYYTGMLIDFETPTDYKELNAYFNPNKLTLVTKEKFNFPYTVHPYVTNAKSPFCYVLSTCSAGTLGNVKKAKRSKNVLDAMKNYFSIYSLYYFSTNNIDFFFFKINGFSKIFRFIKKTMMYQFKDGIYRFKKLYKKIKKLKKNINAIKSMHDSFPKLMQDVIYALTNPLLTDKPITVTEEEMSDIMNQPSENTRPDYIEKKDKLARFTDRMLYYINRFPKFVYIMDNTNYPFNGCKRVRHYK